MSFLLLSVLVLGLSPSYHSLPVSSGVGGYSSNNYMVQQQLTDPVSAGGYVSKYPQSYTSNIPQGFSTYSTEYATIYDVPSQSGGYNSVAQTYAFNNTAYDTREAQATGNTNGGYGDDSVVDYGGNLNFQEYGNEYDTKTNQNYVADYNSQGYGSGSVNNGRLNNGIYYNQQYPVGSYGSSYMQNGKIPSAYQYPKSIQSRFHPTTYEEDSHAGEVVQPPVPESRPAASSQNFSPDFLGVASDSVSVQTPAPLSAPPLPHGYDYQAPPLPSPPPIPDQNPPPYFYSPPSNQYLPVPTAHPPPVPPPPPDSSTQERQVDYTYYYLGPKLWYVPLFFSIYFVLYVAALIIKAISKHKILFPQHLYNAATTVYTGRETRPLDVLTADVTRALTNAAIKYLRRRTTSYP